jgi:hypothetical protein
MLGIPSGATDPVGFLFLLGLFVRKVWGADLAEEF